MSWAIVLQVTRSIESESMEKNHKQILLTFLFKKELKNSFLEINDWIIIFNCDQISLNKIKMKFEKSWYRFEFL